MPVSGECSVDRVAVTPTLAVCRIEFDAGRILIFAGRLGSWPCEIQLHPLAKLGVGHQHSHSNRRVGRPAERVGICSTVLMQATTILTRGDPSTGLPRSTPEAYSPLHGPSWSSRTQSINRGNFMKRLISAALSAFVCSVACAAGAVDSAKVVQVRIDQDGKGMVIFDRPMAGTPPGCVVSVYANALAFGNTPSGRAVMALALTAKTTGSTVTAYGLGTCAVYGSYAEDWNYGVAQ
jgi:hypothetical protein